MKILVLSAGLLAVSSVVAHAQGLAVTGDGRMGVQYDSNGFANNSDWRIEWRGRLNFTGIAEADHGLRLGAFTRVQTDRGVAGPFSGLRIRAEASGLRLTIGNQDGAIATSGAARGIGGRVGYGAGRQHGETGGLRGAVTRFNSTGATGSNAGGESTLHLRYSADNREAAISTERGRGIEIGARATFGAYTLAAGHRTARGGTVQVSTPSAHHDGGGWGVTGLVARVGTSDNWSMAANAALGGGTIHGYVGRTGGNVAFGLSHDFGLGGGARFSAGAERVGGRDTASIGVTFRF